MKDTIGSRTRLGEPEDFVAAVAALARRLRRTSKAASDVQPRTNTAITLERLTRAAADAVELSARPDGLAPIVVLATAARAVFELYIRARHILLSEANVLKWAEEAYIDRIEIYEAILTLPTTTEEVKRVLGSEMTRLREHASKKGLRVDRKRPTLAEVAREAGLEEDYRAFYRLYSKLVHPSSYFVNCEPAEVAGPNTLQTLQINLQLYGHALVGWTCNALALDEGLVAPVEGPGAA